MQPRGGDDDFVGGIAAKTVRQPSGFDEDRGTHREQTQTGQRQRFPNPLIERTIQFELSQIMLLGDFLTRDRAQSKAIFTKLIEDLAMPLRQPRRLTGPPVPNMRVEQNHRLASQASGGTAGPKGSSSRNTEPASDRPD